MLNNEAAEAPKVLTVCLLHKCNSAFRATVCSIQATVAVNRLINSIQCVCILNLK